jgi:hypothetical protein
MKLIWTKSYLPLSLVIRGVTGEPCSHFAFVFESQASGLVFQSNLLGTNPEFYNVLSKTWGFSVVHQLDLPMSVDEENIAWDAIVQQYDDIGYNFGGACYLGWRYGLKRAFKIPLPPTNAWSQPGTMFCDQVYRILNLLNDPRLPKIPVMNGMDTPESVWLKVSGGST